MKEEALPRKKARRKFDANFKREAVTLWQNSGKSAQEIAQQLGIKEGQLYEWKKLSVMPAGASGDVQAEVIALRKENVLLRQQRDILKQPWV